MERTEPKQNLYDFLEVSPRAREGVIRAAYKTLIQEYHPDRGTGDNKVSAKLNEAKDVLLDKKKRKEYDAERNNLEEKTIGNYKVLNMIAEGGFGNTYRGKHKKTGAPVCIKHAHYISPQDEEILIQESNAIWDLRHYGIPVIRDLEKLEDGSSALIMSYVPGPTLEKLVRDTKGLDSEDMSWIAERSLNVLKYLHYNGVVHGDVKPQNIIVQPESHNIVLVDYGLSAIRPTHNTDGNKGFTPLFASPEQEQGRTLLPESDFYSLGLTMIYGLGGDVGKKKVPQSTPENLCRFIKRLIVKDVLSRPSWHKEDLAGTFQKLRVDTFGRRHTGIKAIGGYGGSKK